MAAQRKNRRPARSRRRARSSGYGLPGFRFLIPAAVIAGGWAMLQDPTPLWPDGRPERPHAASATPDRPNAKTRTAALRPHPRAEAMVPPVRPRTEIAAGGAAQARGNGPKPPADVARPAGAPSIESLIAAASRPRTATPSQHSLVPAGKILFASVDANLRMQASGKSEIIAILPRGAAVKLLASRNEWRLVSTSRRLGWVHRDQLEESTASILRPGAALEDAAAQVARK